MMNSNNALQLSSLSSQDKIELLQLLEEKEYRQRRRKFYQWFPDDGPHRRELYVKHMEFFRAGAHYRERAFIAGNRVGKTIVGAYETTCHLTGLYPHWWQGRRFDHPVQWWAAGDTGETVRDIIQLELIGPKNEQGTGMIPGELIVNTTPRQGIPDAIKDIYVKHVAGGVSYCGLKSYDQKRKSFQGTAKHGIWNDEEPPMDVYTEEVMRTMTTRGLMINTFTPLSGLSDVVLSFLPGGQAPKQ